MKRLVPVAVLATCLLVGGRTAVRADETHWLADPNAGPADWFVGTHWSDGVPGAALDAFVANGGLARIDSGAAQVHDLSVGSSGSGAIELSGGSLTAHGEGIRLGAAAAGTFTQTAGNVTAGTLCLGTSGPPGGGQAATYALAGGDLRLGAIRVLDGAARLDLTTGSLVPADGNEVPITFAGQNGQFTFRADGEARLKLTSDGGSPRLTGSNAFTQHGGTVLMESLYLTADGDPCAAPTYNVEDGQMLLDSRWGGYLDLGQNGTINQTGGTVTVRAGDLYVGRDSGTATYNLSGGRLDVLYGREELGLAHGGVLSVGGREPAAAGVLNASGGTLHASILMVEPSSWQSCGAGTVNLAGARIVLSGDSILDSTVGGVLAGHGTITSGGPIRLREGATVTAAGGTLTIDAQLEGGGEVTVQAGATLRTRGILTGLVTNEGTLAASHGALTVSGDRFVNAGDLVVEPGAQLFLASPTLEHDGDVTVGAAGTCAFEQPVVNGPGRRIELEGGTFAAPQLTNAAGAELAGTGTISADLTNRGTADFYGPVRVFGEVRNDPNAYLGIRNGDLLVQGRTYNEGDIKVLNGQAFFDGGLDGNGTVDIDPARVVVGADLRVRAGGALTADAGSTLQLLGDFDNRSARPDAFDLAAGTVQFHGRGTVSDPQWMEAGGADTGPDPAGWVENFAIGRLVVEPRTRLALRDAFDNHPCGSGAEAVYVDELVLVEPDPNDPDATQGWIDLHDTALYYRNGGAPKRLFYGDTDLDGSVGFLDYLQYKRSYGLEAGATWRWGDTDGDGDVDLADYLAAGANFGEGGEIAPFAAGGGAAVPEPTTLGLLLLGAAALSGSRRDCGRCREPRRP